MHREQHRDRLGEQVVDGGESDEGDQEAISPHETQALAQLRQRTAAAGDGAVFPGGDARQGECRDEVRGRGSDEGPGGGQRLDEQPRHPGAADLSYGGRRLKATVRALEVRPARHGGQIGLVAHVERHGEGAQEQDEPDESGQRQHPGDGEADDHDRQESSGEVRDDQDAAATGPIDEHAERQREEQERHPFRRAQQPHLAGARPEHHDGEQRESEVADLRSDGGGPLRDPETAEVRAETVRGVSNGCSGFHALHTLSPELMAQADDER